VPIKGGGGGFYVQTGLIEFSNSTGDVNIPWLGFKLHVDNIYTMEQTTRYAPECSLQMVSQLHS
jgi:hypothetical protein